MIDDICNHQGFIQDFWWGKKFAGQCHSIMHEYAAHISVNASWARGSEGMLPRNVLTQIACHAI